MYVCSTKGYLRGFDVNISANILKYLAVRSYFPENARAVHLCHRLFPVSTPT